MRSTPSNTRKKEYVDVCRCMKDQKDFLNDHSHCTQYNGVTSALAMINASIVQGSVLGPASFVVTASDLKALGMNNSLKNTLMTLS